jgi:hypothetical protein
VAERSALDERSTFDPVTSERFASARFTSDRFTSELVLDPGALLSRFDRPEVLFDVGGMLLDGVLVLLTPALSEVAGVVRFRALVLVLPWSSVELAVDFAIGSDEQLESTSIPVSVFPAALFVCVDGVVWGVVCCVPAVCASIMPADNGTANNRVFSFMECIPLEWVSGSLHI